MAKDREVSRVEIRDWGGLVTHADRQDIAPGSGRLQVNLQSDRPGSLRVRRGLSLVQFDARGLVELSDIVSVQESVTAFLEYRFVTISDTLTVSESVTPYLFRALQITDSIALTETVSAEQVVQKSDSVSVGEQINVARTISRSVSDSVIVSTSLAYGIG